MDKSFNDQELSDIMKEIEALEEDFKADEGEKVEPSSVIEELAELDEKKSVPVQEAEVLHLETPKSCSKSPTSLSFKVQGELALQMQFEVNGKFVSLDVSESGLNIQMEGGVTFSVPLEKKSA